jgi:hypothetical protein
MSIMKRTLCIEIVSGKDTCQECDYWHDEECHLFDQPLDDEGHRLAECIEAEGKMIDTHIRMAAKTAQI